jgi:hypothetical protein
LPEISYHSITVFYKINLIEVESFCRNALHYASYIPKNLEQKAGIHLPKATNIVFQKNNLCAYKRLKYGCTEKSMYKKRDVQTAHLF